MSSDGSGLGAAWHLASVEVLDTSRGILTSFPCGKWLEPSKDPASLQQTLLPEGAAAAGGAGGLLQYEVVVHTSDVRGGGTDANVSIQLVGDKVRSDWLGLLHPGMYGVFSFFKLWAVAWSAWQTR